LGGKKRTLKCRQLSKYKRKGEWGAAGQKCHIAPKRIESERKLEISSAETKR